MVSRSGTEEIVKLNVTTTKATTTALATSVGTSSTGDRTNAVAADSGKNRV